MITNKRKNKSNGKTKTKKKIMKGGAFKNFSQQPQDVPKVNPGNTSGSKGKATKQPSLWERITGLNKAGTRGKSVGKKGSERLKALKTESNKKSGAVRKNNGTVISYASVPLKSVTSNPLSNKKSIPTVMTPDAQNFLNIMMRNQRQPETTSVPNQIAFVNPQYVSAASTPSTPSVSSPSVSSTSSNVLYSIAKNYPNKLSPYYSLGTANTSEYANVFPDVK
jgi:hypothetical protein